MGLGRYVPQRNQEASQGPDKEGDVKVGDLVRINDLCSNKTLSDTTGTVIEIGIEEEWHSWLLASVLTVSGLVKFREDTPQLEVI